MGSKLGGSFRLAESRGCGPLQRNCGEDTGNRCLGLQIKDKEGSLISCPRQEEEELMQSSGQVGLVEEEESVKKSGTEWRWVGESPRSEWKDHFEKKGRVNNTWRWNPIRTARCLQI